MKKLTNIFNILTQLVGHDYLYFQTPITVRPSKISYPFNAWAVCAGPDKKVYVMDSDQQWFPLENNAKSEELIDKINDRLIEISKKMGKEVFA